MFIQKPVFIRVYLRLNILEIGARKKFLHYVLGAGFRKYSSRK